MRAPEGRVCRRMPAEGEQVSFWKIHKSSFLYGTDSTARSAVIFVLFIWKAFDLSIAVVYNKHR